jgi:nicotinamidase-related amidase
MGTMNPPDQGTALDRLEPRRIAVVLVDFQNDFCRPSDPGHDPAQTAANAAAASRASAFAAAASAVGMRVIYTQQILDLTRLDARQRRWEKHSRLCRDGSPGADLFIEPVPGSRVVRKYRFDIWQSSEFRRALTDWDIDGLIIGGVELICCVLHAVLGAEERGYGYLVPLDLVSGMCSTERPANRAVRDYLRAVHPTIDHAHDLLARWQADGAHSAKLAALPGRYRRFPPV